MNACIKVQVGYDHINETWNVMTLGETLMCLFYGTAEDVDQWLTDHKEYTEV